MKRARQKRRGGIGRDAEQLAWLASGLAESGSRAEDRYWESQLGELVDRLLAEEAEDEINTTLDHLNNTAPRAFDELADFVESRAESVQLNGTEFDTLLIAAPILAWSRYQIPACPINPSILANLRVHLQAHVLAEGARLALADFLFSPDQLPQGFCATAQFAAALSMAAREQQDLRIDTSNLPDTSQFLSDTRYLLAAVVVPRGAPFFRWQEPGGSREQALAQWRAQGGACLTPLLPGCALEIVLPEAYFAACREADRLSRPYAVRASVAFLGATLDVPATRLRAVIAPFHERQLEEYRIGLCLANDEQVVHGVVWPLLGNEDENSDIAGQIDTVLRESGVHDIVHIEHAFPLEYCDDCGSPLYPSPDGELLHAEMPENAGEPIPRHLH